MSLGTAGQWLGCPGAVGCRTLGCPGVGMLWGPQATSGPRPAPQGCHCATPSPILAGGPGPVRRLPPPLLSSCSGDREVQGGRSPRGCGSGTRVAPAAPRSAPGSRGRVGASAGAVGTGRERDPGGRAPGAAAGSVVAEGQLRGGPEPKPSCRASPSLAPIAGLGALAAAGTLICTKPPPRRARHPGRACVSPRRVTGPGPAPRAGGARGASDGESKIGPARAAGSCPGPSTGSVCAHVCWLPVGSLGPRWGFAAPGALGHGEVARCPLPAAHCPLPAASSSFPPFPRSSDALMGTSVSTCTPSPSLAAPLTQPGPFLGWGWVPAGCQLTPGCLRSHGRFGDVGFELGVTGARLVPPRGCRRAGAGARGPPRTPRDRELRAGGHRFVPVPRRATPRTLLLAAAASPHPPPGLAPALLFCCQYCPWAPAALPARVLPPGIYRQRWALAASPPAALPPGCPRDPSAPWGAPGSLSGHRTAPNPPDLGSGAAAGPLSLPPQLGDPGWHPGPAAPAPARGIPRCHSTSQPVLAARGPRPGGQRGPSAEPRRVLQSGCPACK
ncbi:uncharacterized protein LOC142404488 [Mycteria americana]|uniref:uncharacterized protein LOC142404488 n=1 Tax=Mycteria americana TaxID=33587 RepID=UPI003F58479C